MVSVIVVTYNRAVLLAKCLSSIVKQTYDDLEIIVVDDGSTDNSEKIVHGMNDERIVYIKKEKTGNLSMLRNIGIRASKGDCIAFCDDDDLWMNNKVEVMMEYMKTEAIVCSNAYVIDQNDKVLFDKISDFDCDRYIGFSQLLEDNRIQTSCVMVRKNILIDVGLFDEMYGNRSEDWCLWIKISQKHEIKYVNIPLVSYRIHDENLSMKSFDDKLELANRNIEILLPYLNHHEHLIVVSAKIGLSLVYRNLTKLYYNNGFLNESSISCRKFLELYNKKFSIIYIKFLVFYFYLLLRK